MNRREFTKATLATLASVSIVPRHVLGGPNQKAPSDRLNIAGIGVGGQGASNLKECEEENIVALCDVDFERAAETFKRHPRAAIYQDFREMFDKEKDNIDAVVIATPDHTHAVATIRAIEAGKHIYCQKPLTHTVTEARIITRAAREKGIQTQMGNQGHSSEHIRLLKEWIDDGAIGNVTEVHAWTDRPVGGNPWSDFLIQAKPAETPPVPDTLNWDLWLGPVAWRAYHPLYCPLKWRSWIDFGTGSLGDMGCHILDPAFYALDLGMPETISATSTHWQEEVSSQTFPRASIVRYYFPARGNKPPVKLTWYDGRLRPQVPEDFEPGRNFPGSGAFIVGDKGAMLHGSHGAGGLRIVPETKMQAYQRPPETIPRVTEGHVGDWIRACKDGKPASSTFDYGGPLTEMVLLGVLAIRMKDQVLEYDAKQGKFTNNDAANELLHIDYREGWTL
ncbi:gfo/Idh/MocA family oxidoreductase [candidate division KSB1 bacterium]|nr:gfo/Idh/MocA family oxidoreductase [candidate division KSB1 bacterium]